MNEPEPPTFIEADPSAKVERGPDPEVPGLTLGDCPGEVADVPSVLFGERVLIRLPNPLIHEDLVESGPNRAHTTHPITLAVCKPGRTVALEAFTIDLRDPDPGDALTRVRDDALGEHGLLDRITLREAEIGPDPREATWVYSLDDVDPSSNLLVAVRSGSGSLVVAIYQAPTRDWKLVVNALLESSKRIHLIPSG